VSDLLLHAAPPNSAGLRLQVTPDSAGLSYVGFELLSLAPGAAAARACGARELCVVVVEGRADVRSQHGVWDGLGGRADPWSGLPEAAYLPPGSDVVIAGSGSQDAEVALCWAPAPGGGAQARRLLGSEIDVEVRGHGAQERFIHPILMGDRDAESLLVCEVITPDGHWSSYPPHKHDVADPPRETFLEETYYHRVSPAQGFGFQRVYSADRSLDESVAFADRDCVLVPRGYHTVSAPPGYRLYYLNVMAGPTRLWAVANDPDHGWVAARPD
jgi:5-deoxy-glucuronate isomerase